MSLSTEDVPTKTEIAPIVGETATHTLDDFKRYREQAVAFFLARQTLEDYFRDKKNNEVKSWVFPQLLKITKEWMKQCVVLKDNAFPQMLLIKDYTYDASDRIYRAIVMSTEGEKTLQPILQPYNTTGSTRYVDFDTTKAVYRTRPDKCHVSHVVGDTDSWEQKMAQSLEDMEEVVCYVKNQNLGFGIPYTINGEEKTYLPDFIVRINDGNGKDNPLNLIIEVTGQKRHEKEAKTATAKTLWVPAVNNHGGFGRWDFIENTDPWNAINLIRDFLKKRKAAVKEES